MRCGSHLLLLRRRLVVWFGMVVVAQSVVASLVNSYLFDFTPGWTYAVCVELRRSNAAPKGGRRDGSDRPAGAQNANLSA